MITWHGMGLLPAAVSQNSRSSSLFKTQVHPVQIFSTKNTVGMPSTILESYKRRIVNFKKNRGKLRKQAGELKRLYGKELEGQDKGKAELLEGFINGKRRLILDGKLYRQRKSDSFIMKLFLLLGWL
mgnify:CR=1 FL=1